MAAALVVWRHPRPEGAEGRCIGHTDLGVDRRKAKRLAHRIRARVRAHGWPAKVLTSPLRRSADVGRWLARWGFSHHIDPRLSELDFGRWDGRLWAEIDEAEIKAWSDNFADYAAGGGESVRGLMERCAEVMGEVMGDVGADVMADDGAETRGTVCVVGHAGWINAARWVVAGRVQPGLANEWPHALRYGDSVALRLSKSGGAESQ